MEYLHLIRDEDEKELVRRVAQNDPTTGEFSEIIYADANLLLALGHALIGNTCLRKLNFWELELTKESAHALAQGMAQSKIDRLSFGDLLSSQGRVCDIFYRGIQASTTIQELELWQSPTNDPGNAWRGALLGIPLITIYLPQHQHGYNQAFSEVLSRTTVLRDLTLNLGQLEPNNITMLAHSLQQNTSLTKLCLRNTGLNNQHEQLLFAQGLNPNSGPRFT